MTFEEMQWRDYRAMLQTRHQTATMLGMPGMEPWPPDKAARLMAIMQVFGNNEHFTHSPKFLEDCKYIQELYHIEGGETPDAEFVQCYPKWERLYDAVKKDDDPVFVEAQAWIKMMYGFKISV